MAYSNFNNDISDYYKLISQIPLISREEELELMKKASMGDKAAQKKLVESNLRFVVKIAFQFKGKGLDLEDLISEGNTGLIIAASKVDPSKNVRFITYASWWIRQSITKALFDSGKSVRIPLNQKSEFTDSKWNSVSIYDSYGSNENVSLCDMISDEKTPNPEQNFFKDVDEEIMEKALETLSETEIIVLNYRYGLNDCDKLSLSEIGEKIGVSRESVRQMEIKILKKLRNFVYQMETVAYAA